MDMQQRLMGALIGLARATDGNEHLICESATAVIVEALAATGNWEALCARVEAEKRKMVPDCFLCANPCGKNSDFDMRKLDKADEDVRELKLRLLDTIRQTAKKGISDLFFYKALIVIGLEDYSAEDLLPIVEEAEEIAQRV